MQKQKLIKSQELIEYIEYSNPLKGKKQRCVTKRKVSEEEKIYYREQNLRKIKKKIKRYVYTNYFHGFIDGKLVTTKFLTLTFKDNVQDLDKANYEFKKFKQRLERKLKMKLLYLCVVEFQKRGAIHFHVIVFNMPYIASNEMAKIWGNGFIKINAVKSKKEIVSYLTKYLTKDLHDERLMGRKSYFASKFLKKPQILEGDKAREFFCITFGLDNVDVQYIVEGDLGYGWFRYICYLLEGY